MDDEAKHVEFLLQTMRAAMLRCKLFHADLETISTALKGDLIGADTAVQWIREANLLWLVGAIPEAVGKIEKTTKPLESEDAATPVA